MTSPILFAPKKKTNAIFKRRCFADALFWRVQSLSLVKKACLKDAVFLFILKKMTPLQLNINLKKEKDFATMHVIALNEASLAQGQDFVTRGGKARSRMRLSVLEEQHEFSSR